MAPKPWTGISTACTHWFSLLPQEKNRRQGRHGDGPLLPPRTVFACPEHEDRLPNLCASRKVRPASLVQGMGKEGGIGVCRFLCSRTYVKPPLSQGQRLGQGVLLPSPGWVSAYPPWWQAIVRVLDIRNLVLCAGGLGRPGIRLFKGFWARSTVD